MDDARKGYLAALLAPVFLGMAPFWGKLALVGGAEPFTVAAIRTALVAIMLWVGYALFWRKYIYIFPAGLLACIAIGFTNGIGSLYYYNGLDRLDASVAQILNATYVIFVVLLSRISGTNVSAYTILRVIVALTGVLLIAGGLQGNATWLGIGFMLGNALLFGGTVVMSQRILYEMPAQTVTLYVMTAMATIVVVARLVSNQHVEPISQDGGFAILALGISTALSRLLLFAGVKGVGSLRTTLLAVAESAVAVCLAFAFLGETLTLIQWLGVVAIVISLFLPTEVKDPSPDSTPRFGSLPNVAGFRFRRMSEAADKLSSQEMRSITQMMIGSTDALSELDLAQLRSLLGDDGVKKLMELEEKHSRKDS